jgi:hypothetical protein
MIPVNGWRSTGAFFGLRHTLFDRITQLGTPDRRAVFFRDRPDNFFALPITHAIDLATHDRRGTVATTKVIDSPSKWRTTLGPLL